MSESNNVVVFACNWDGLSAVETAASKRLAYPASVKVIRVSCLSRVHAGLILKAFELGTAGVMLLGCEPANCHFKVDSEVINAQFEKVQGILKLMGMNEDRLVLTRLPQGDAVTFVKKVKEMAEKFERVSFR